jgi:nucleoside-diphosphate-sugar epimerase
VIVGTGLVAKAFRPSEALLDNVCIYAAGVSNSSCSDEGEFIRDRLRLQQTIATLDSAILLVYFSTCSVDDPWSSASRYVAHKRELERIVQDRTGPSVVVRASQVAGLTPNPHTILNYLYVRIARSERFDLWQHAYRNIIDVADVERIVLDLIRNEKLCSGTVNVANRKNSPITEIVAAFENITNRRAIYNLLDKGGEFAIDTAQIEASVVRNRIIFDPDYLARTLAKYYVPGT